MSKTDNHFFYLYRYKSCKKSLPHPSIFCRKRYS